MSDGETLPLWTRRALRRHRLLALGISLSEQSVMATTELDAILAVNNVIVDYQNEEAERANR